MGGKIMGSIFWGVYTVQEHIHWGKLNLFDVWQIGEVIVLVHGKGGVGISYENIHLNAG